MYHVLSNQNNANGKCANTCCAFKFRNMFPKAVYYHVSEKSWVCTTCAQGINRERLGKAMQYGANYSQICINSEDALVLMLQRGYVTPQVPA
jgi:hypothetical protein